ncbi:TPA: DUF4393 domain-containing protein [Streptococcus agalactiae]|nr:DUF4393 domain-containing protein [Streptococcus agalactiae]HEO5910894.1 DUF4393 domain-containing protein [Streptococcus agalactiae]
MIPIKLDLSADLTSLVETTNTVLKPISEGLAGIFAYAFQLPRRYNVVSDIELKQLAESTKQKFQNIPVENQSFEKIKSVGKILEDSIYQLNDETFRNYYACLISASCDSTKHVKPYYSSLIKEMSSKDALLLDYFFDNRVLFEVELSSNNELFEEPTEYRYVFEKRYFKHNAISERYLFRDFNNKKYISGLYHYGSDFFEDDVNQELKFLVSAGIVEDSKAEKSHEYIPSIEKYVIQTDERAQEFIEQNNYTVPKVELAAETKVYTLSNLGLKLKELLKQ